jgi:two-component system cell cycle sensor histidine kinase/response regulator CckA
MDRRILAALKEAPATVVLLEGPELRYAWMNDLYLQFSPQVQVGDLFGTTTPQALQFRALAQRVFKSGEPARLHEIEVEQAETGEHFWFDLLIQPSHDESGAITAVVMIGTDVSETVKTRRALDEQAERTRRAEAQLHSILDHVPLFVITLDPAGRVAFVAGAEVRRRGGNPAEVVGRNIFDLVGDDPATAAVWRRALAGETFIATITRPTGVVYETWCRPVRGEHGEMEMTIGVGIDVTERRRAQDERARIQEKMLQAQKLESLGVLAGGIAHDFNNLLTVIQGNAAVAQSRLAGDHPARELIDDILGATQRAADLTRQMLAYSGKGRIEIRPLDMRQHVREIGRLLSTSIPKKVHLRIVEPSWLPTVQADPSQMHQVLMNLVLNAAEAIGDRGGEVVVSLAEEEVGADGGGDLVGPERLPEGRYVRLTVTDTGSGMDAGVRARIFDPFFTTKATGRGLGLAAVLGIVRGHGGALRIDSKPGLGTKFDVLIPAGGARANPAKSGEVPSEPGKGLVLVIDDEEHVRVATARLLASIGYDVLEAADGEHGAEIYRANAGRIDAVVLDLTMPHLSGEETLAILRAIDPDVRVVFFSGYAETDVEARIGGLNPAAVLHKPFTRQQLAIALHAAMQ